MFIIPLIFLAAAMAVASASFHFIPQAGGAIREVRRCLASGAQSQTGQAGSSVAPEPRLSPGEWFFVEFSLGIIRTTDGYKWTT